MASPPSIMIGMPVYREMAPETLGSFISTWVAINRTHKATTHFEFGWSQVTLARDAIADAFLASDFDLLAWIDADMTWDLSTFLRMTEQAAKLDCVGGAYALKRDPPRPVVRLIDGVPDESEGCFAVAGLGMGFCCVTRKVMEKIAENKPKQLLLDGRVIKQIFRTENKKTPPALMAGADFQLATEDMCFFDDVREAGFKVWLDPALSIVGHVGPKVYAMVGEGAVAR